MKSIKSIFEYVQFVMLMALCVVGLKYADVFQALLTEVMGR